MNEAANITAEAPIDVALLTSNTSQIIYICYNETFDEANITRLATHCISIVLQVNEVMMSGVIYVLT
jgi:hypothetical protein